MFAYPSQRLQDWLSQQWVMARGHRVEAADIPWLIGPFGNVDVISDQYVAKLAADEGLSVERPSRGAGLLPSLAALDLPPADFARLRPEVRAFYERTTDHDLEVWSEWSALFRPFGALIQVLYSRRLQQLNLPLRPLDTSRGMDSQIVLLRDPARGGALRHTIWYRRLKATGRVIYSGVYGTSRLPGGRTCIKVVFPLPCGNATVVMQPTVGPDGELELVSAGAGFGDPGFYFLLADARGCLWGQYIRSFRERIVVYVDAEGVLRTDHVLTWWRRRVLELHYKITPHRDAAVAP